MGRRAEKVDIILQAARTLTAQRSAPTKQMWRPSPKTEDPAQSTERPCECYRVSYPRAATR